MSRRWFMLLALCIAGCDADRASGPPPDLELGETKFHMFCSPCHGKEGQGTENGPPPLDRSPWVMGPETRLIRIVLHGVRGAIRVQGREYNLEMPGFGPILRDGDVAAILSYVRHRFGGPSPPVSGSAVAEVRARYPDRMDYWTAEELLEDG